MITLLDVDLNCLTILSYRSFPVCTGSPIVCEPCNFCFQYSAITFSTLLHFQITSLHMYSLIASSSACIHVYL